MRKNLLQKEVQGHKFNNNIEIVSKNSEYDRLENKIIAEKNVVVLDKENNNKLFSDKITYFKNEEKFITEGSTRALSLTII